MPFHRICFNQSLASAQPTVPQFQSFVAASHNNFGNLLAQTGKLAEALAAHQKGLAICSS